MKKPDASRETALQSIAAEGTQDPAVQFASRWHQPAAEGSGTLRDQAIETLRSDCVKGSHTRPLEMDLRGINLVGQDLKELNLSGYDFTGADLSGANLSRADLSRAVLCQATLRAANLNRSEFLGADLSGANLNECSAERCGLGAANLTRASLISANLLNASLSKATLKDADCRAVNLSRARINETDLSGASFIRANLKEADLKSSNVAGTSFELADLSGSRLLGIKNFQKANWIGADIRDIDLRGAYMVRRHIADENYLYEFRTRGRWNMFLYDVWWLTSDCGRSLSRWAIWVLGFTMFFGFLYQIVEVDFGPHETAFSAFYYSIVTLTTLGYGDAVPASLSAQILASIQAFLGYLGLGGLLSILSNKMARRAE